MHCPASNRGTAGLNLVVGLGRTGVSVVRHLLSRGLEVKAVDTRAAPPGLEVVRAGFPSLRFGLGEFDTAD